MLLLRIAAVFQIFDGLQTVTLGALRGVGDVRLPFVFAVIAYWVIGLPLSLFLGFALHLGAVGFWWGVTLGLAVAALSSRGASRWSSASPSPAWTRSEYAVTQRTPLRWSPGRRPAFRRGR